jgi:hypothetical protein
LFSPFISFEDPLSIPKHLEALVSMLLEEQMMLEGQVDTGKIHYLLAEG